MLQSNQSDLARARMYQAQANEADFWQAYRMAQNGSSLEQAGSAFGEGDSVSERMPALDSDRPVKWYHKVVVVLVAVGHLRDPREELSQYR